MSNLMPEILGLTLAERIQLVEDLWDSIAAEAPESLGLSNEQLAEVKLRVEAHAHEPGAAVSWEQVRAELKRDAR